jgi:hypothetical protein
MGRYWWNFNLSSDIRSPSGGDYLMTLAALAAAIRKYDNYNATVEVMINYSAVARLSKLNW